MGRMTPGTNVAQLFDAIDPRPNPEDIRIAEAMVFASAEPLEEILDRRPPFQRRRRQDRHGGVGAALRRSRS